MSTRIGRPMDTRLRLRGWLRVQTPLHVGGIALDPAEALPVAVDGQDRAYVPGTGLAGPLRAWMRGTDTRPQALEDLWGFVPDGQPGEGNASRVIVHDAVITATARTGEDGLPADPIDPVTLPARHGVGIDRFTGAVAPEFLYARTIIPPGSHLLLELDVESTTQHRDRDRARLAALLQALEAGRIPLGAATRRGLGAVRLLPGWTVYEQDFTRPDGLLAFLTGTPTQAELGDPDGADLPEPREQLAVCINWRPAAPVMVRASGEGASIGALPLTTRFLGSGGQDGESVVLTLPGGSIKGALRFHAEFIERTARQQCAPKRPAKGASARDHSESFRAQLDQLPAVRDLFGAASNGTAHDGRGSGALTAHECISRTTIGADLWETVSDGSTNANDDGEPEGRPPQLPAADRDRLAKAGLDQADHVAIDRWTGGAADGRLFSVLEPHGVRWKPILLTLDLTRLGEHRDPRRDTGLALLLLVLRDLEAGRIQLGGMANRGFGDIEVESITLTGGDWPDGATLRQALHTDPLEQAWQTYLNTPL